MLGELVIYTGLLAYGVAAYKVADKHQRDADG